MDLGTLRARLLLRLNRTDCTNVVADGFIEEGLERVASECRYRWMEKTEPYSYPGSPAQNLALPADYLQMIDFMFDGAPLDYKSYRELGRCDFSSAAKPTMFAINGQNVVLGGTLDDGSEAELVYYARPAALLADDNLNTVTVNAPSLLLYAALSVAGDHFQHDKTAEWEARYLAAKSRLDDEKIVEEAARSPRAVVPLYYDPGV